MGVEGLRPANRPPAIYPVQLSASLPVCPYHSRHCTQPLPLCVCVCMCAAAVYYFAERFMLWSAFQALVMLVQNRYQKRRMYTRIAMGKNSAMDVVSGESSGSAGQLMVLYPLLFSKFQVKGERPSVLLWVGETGACGAQACSLIQKAAQDRQASRRQLRTWLQHYGRKDDT